MKKKVAMLAAIPGSAMAEVPAWLTAELTQAQSDTLTIALLVLSIVVSIAAFLIIRKALL